jgi:hypothetical protein
MDIILASLAIVALLIVISLRKAIYLNIIRIVYGYYSLRYIKKFKKFTRKKPHPYCFKDDFYYHILAVKKALACPQTYTTKKNILFDEMNFGKAFKQVIKENGRADCYTMSDEQGFPLKVAGYKSRMFHSNEKTLMYFCGNKYFMGEYVFSNLADETPNLLIKKLQDDYQVDIQYAKNFTIKDPANNTIYFTDTGFFLSLKFFNSDNNMIKSILKFTDNDGEIKTGTRELHNLNC